MPVATSCHSHVDIIVATAVPTKRLCSVVSPGGTSTGICGELSPHKDLAISAKPAWGFCFCVQGLSSSVFTLWLETVNKLATGAVVVGFTYPILWVTEKEPWVWALQLLLWLCSWEVAGSAGLGGLDEVVFTQCNGTLLWRTSPSVNVMDSLNSHMHSANCCGWSGRGGWTFSAQNCNTLAYATVFRGYCIQ